MCARLLACPLCSQPGFLTLDSLRAGLVSVATRPLACPVCNEVLLGIDKLTIHLFGHTVSAINTPVGGGNESAKFIENASSNAQQLQQVRHRNAIQSWNVINAQSVDTSNAQVNDANNRDSGNTPSGIYIPIDEIETFRNLTSSIKDASAIIQPVQSTQSTTNEMKAPSQVLVLQNVGSQPKLFSADLIDQIVQPHEQTSLYQTIPAATTATPVPTNGIQDIGHPNANADLIEIGVQNQAVELDKNTQTSWSKGTSPAEASSTFTRSHTDRLEELVKSAQITSSPLGTFHEAYDCSRPNSPPKIVADASTGNNSSGKPIIKSTRIFMDDERVDRCNICGIGFPGRNVLILHKQLAHAIKERDANVSPDDLMKNYPCHLCTKLFKMRGSLMVHMRVAHPGVNMPRVPKPVPEPVHQEPSIQELDTANDEPEGNYICPTCGKSFKQEHQVTQHIKTHDIKQFECDVCSKLFTTKYFLKKHKRLHSGEMPYKCTICDKTFTFQQSYHKHRLYHKDDKPHTCTTCGRSFKELSTLHNHERIHTGEKPFACESCGKCFRQRVSYLVHRRIHTGAMPYQCAYCNKYFRYKVSQRTHKCPKQPHDETEQAGQSGEASQASLENDNSEMKDALEVSSQDEQSMDESVTSEDNHQYILVLGNDGQHVLKKKSEIDDESSKASDMLASEQQVVKQMEHKSNDAMDDIWSHDQSSRMEFKESGNSKENEAPILDNSCAKLWNETLHDDNKNDNGNNSPNNDSSDLLWNEIAAATTTTTTTSDTAAVAVSPADKSNANTRDFLSMILDNEITSPSAEMEHLRLSSPLNNQDNNSTEANDGFLKINKDHASGVQVDHMHEAFNDRNHLSNLQTINEDSLKELLNSIADK